MRCAPPAGVLTDKTLLLISRVPINKPDEPERIVAEWMYASIPLIRYTVVNRSE